MLNTRIVEMLEVTEAAAYAAGRWMGKGDKMAADQAAVEAMRPRYVPGPYVEVEGLLPDGLASLRRVATGAPVAHTLPNPFIVPGAELRPGPLPSGPSEGAPGVALAHVDPEASSLHVIPGVPASLVVATRSVYSKLGADGGDRQLDAAVAELKKKLAAR